MESLSQIELSATAPVYPADPRIALAMRLAEAMHQYGVPTDRLEAAMKRVLGRLGLPGDFMVTPTSILASFGSPEEHRTSLIRAQPGEVNLDKLAQINDLVTDLIQWRTGVEEADAALSRTIAAPSRYGPVWTVLCVMLSCCAATRFLGGGGREIAATAVISLFIAAVSAGMPRVEEPGFDELAAAFFAGALAIVAAYLFPPLSVYTVTLGSLVILLPGLTVTTAMRELATRNLVAGTARLMGAVLLLVQLGFGVALGWQMTRWLPVSLDTLPQPLPLWTLGVALLVAPLAFATLFRAARRDLGWIVLACWISFGGARLGSRLFGAELGAFLGAMLVAAASNLFARYKKRPAAITLLPGIVILGPGSIGFGSVAKLMEKDIVSGVQTAFTMILIAVALAMGVLMANVLVPPRKVL